MTSKPVPEHAGGNRSRVRPWNRFALAAGVALSLALLGWLAVACSKPPGGEPAVLGGAPLATPPAVMAGMSFASISIMEMVAPSADVSFTLRWISPDVDRTASVAWGDVDGDGDLDLAVGNRAASNRIYLNEGGIFSVDPSAAWVSEETDDTSSLAWGDVDGDGDLDLVVGNKPEISGETCSGGRERLYRNDGGELTSAAVWSSGRCDDTEEVVLGDVDGDGDLDLVVENCAAPKKCGARAYLVYLNDGGKFPSEPSWPSDEITPASDLAWEDVNNDGRLDLAAAGKDGIRVYLGEGLQLGATAAYTIGAGVGFDKLVWGRMDPGGNAYLLAVNAEGVFGFRNENGRLDSEPTRLVPLEGSRADSLALDDADGDGDSDLAVGIYCERGPAPCPLLLYRNDSGQFTAKPPLRLDDKLSVLDLAWGDVDNDGDLDLAAGVGGSGRAPNRLYRNRTPLLVAEPLPGPEQGLQTTGLEYATALAWGDVDGDRDLDLAMAVAQGDGHEPTAVYLNEDGGLRLWKLLETTSTTALAWGDVDGDLDLDLAVGNKDKPSQLYLNQGGELSSSPGWSSAETDNTTSLAWGDVDADGDLDLAVGSGQLCKADAQGKETCTTSRSRLYLNQGRALGMGPHWSAARGEDTRSIAWGDVDNDGDLDLAASSYGRSSRLYVNQGGQLRDDVPGAWISSETTNATGLAWADVDGDGDLDLAVGSDGEAIRLYRNDDGQLDSQFYWTSLETHTHPSLAWGDVDGDGDLDLAVYGRGTGRLYQNENGVLASNAAWAWDGRPGGNLASDSALAWGDVDGDGDLDLAAGGQLLRNLRNDRLLQAQLPVPNLQYPGPGTEARSYAQALVFDRPVVPISYTLAASQVVSPQVEVRGFYALSGGDWREATPVSTTPTASLTTGAHVFEWDVAADGLMGRNDGVAFRLQAIPQRVQGRSAAGGPLLHGSSSASTSPFLVSGLQVRVVHEITGSLAISAASKPISDAVVYKLDAGQMAGAALLGNDVEPFRTDDGGYLQGRDQVKKGDRLVALWPLPQKDQPDPDKYTVYHTSAQPTKTGLDAHEVTAERVQTLTVSANHPLILFDLDVSLEWDARNDGTFLQELEQSIQRASEILYDITNGQAALGDVRVWQDKQNWLQSDVVIYASGSVRPRASLGGVVEQPTDDEDRLGNKIPRAFLPGQVRMGPGWDPFGQSRADLGRDWWRALAHELAHHLLYLPDNYLGYGQAGNVVKVDCPGSIMTTAYDDAYGELLDFSGKKPDEWGLKCENTLAAKTTGRSDWETLDRFYPALIKPTETVSGGNPGPAVLPLGVTRVQVYAPLAAAATYPARNFDLRDEEGNRLAVPQGQGYLVRNGGNQNPTDDILVPLGSTGQADYIKVRGAADGDRLCLFDFNSRPPQLGCIPRLTPLDNTITLSKAPKWSPNVQVAPIQLPVLTITVTQSFTGGSAGVTAVPGQPDVAVSVTPLISPAAVVEVGPAGGASGFSIAISPTKVITGGEPDFRVVVVQRTGGSLAITTAAPTTRGAPAIVSISRPALLVTVTQPITGGQLRTQVLPAYGRWSSDAIPLEPVATDVSTRTALVPLEVPVYAGYARVWQESPGALREAISPFFFAASRQPDGTYTWGAGSGVNLGTGVGPNDRGGLGPNDRGGLGPNDRGGLGPNDRGGLGPNDRGGLGPNDRGGLGPNDRGGLGTDERGFNTNRRAMGAPIASSDGQVTIFNSLDILGDTGTTSLQALPAPPNLPAQLTPVGQSYRFEATGNVSRTIEFGYLQREVPQGYEHTLVVYYSGNEGKSWERLPTGLDVDDNQATAPADRSGIYVLASAVDVPFYSKGWNLFAYPIPAKRPVVDALRSISGTYTTVYGYNGGNPDDPWQVFDTQAPDWANDLTSLEFGRAYWINVSEPITLQLEVAGSEPYTATPGVTLAQLINRRTPPAVYYGALPVDGENIVVTAWVDGNLCGQAEAKAVEGGYGYVIKVDAADDLPKAGCGAPGREVAFKLGRAPADKVDWDRIAPVAASDPSAGSVPWDNTAPRRLDLVSAP